MSSYTSFTLKVCILSEPIQLDVFRKVLSEQAVHGWEHIHSVVDEDQLWIFFGLEKPEEFTRLQDVGQNCPFPYL